MGFTWSRLGDEDAKPYPECYRGPHHRDPVLPGMLWVLCDLLPWNLFTPFGYVEMTFIQILLVPITVLALLILDKGSTLFWLLSLDTTVISYLILGILLFTTLFSLYQAYRLPLYYPGQLTGARRRIKKILQVGEGAAVLGFVGTVWALLVTLSALDLDKVGDISTMGTEVLKVLSGLGIAFSTTLLGLCTSLVCLLYYLILDKGIK